MDWTPREACAADYFAGLGFQLEGTLTHSAVGPTAAYGLVYDGRPYPLPGGKRFPTIEAMEEAFDRLMPTFRLHATCCHHLVLRCVESATDRAAVEAWLAADALTALKPANATFPWTSAEQAPARGGFGYLRTFGPPWTGVDPDCPVPAWAMDDNVCARFDPARPRVYLDALRLLLQNGEALWLGAHLPLGAAPKAGQRL